MAIAVYCLFRVSPPVALASLQASNPLLLYAEGYFGSAPSFFYTLSIGLFIGAIAGSHSRSRLHCSLWVLLALCLEVSQHAIFAERLAAWTIRYEDTAAGVLINPYWSYGTFDPLDLLATLAAGSIALALSTRMLPWEKNAADR